MRIDILRVLTAIGLVLVVVGPATSGQRAGPLWAGVPYFDFPLGVPQMSPRPILRNDHYRHAGHTIEHSNAVQECKGECAFDFHHDLKILNRLVLSIVKLGTAEQVRAKVEGLSVIERHSRQCETACYSSDQPHFPTSPGPLSQTGNRCRHRFLGA